MNNSKEAKAKWLQITEAFDTLGDPKSRRHYDATGETSNDADQYDSEHRSAQDYNSFSEMFRDAFVDEQE